MKKAKYISLLLILVLVVTLISGCTSDESGNTNPEPAIAGENESTETVDGGAAENTETPVISSNTDADVSIPEGYFTRVGNDKVTVAIPTVWKDKYYAVIDENMVMLYQKQALYKGVGRLCGFEIFTDDSYKELPWNYDIISQDGKRTLIVHYPSDVQADTEDEASMKEYNEMYKMISQIVKTATIIK